MGYAFTTILILFLLLFFYSFTFKEVEERFDKVLISIGFAFVGLIILVIMAIIKTYI